MGSLEKRKQLIIESQLTSNKKRKDWEVSFDSLKDDYLQVSKRADSAENDCLKYIERLQQSRISKEFEDDDKELGRGAYGSVYKWKHKLDGKCYAIKRISFVGSNAIILPEVYALSSLKHEGIVQYHTSWIEDDYIEPGKTFVVVPFRGEGPDLDIDEDVAIYFDLRENLDEPKLPRSLFIQMEMCKGSLYEEIIKGEVDYNRGFEFFTQIVEAVAYMHGQRVIHKDLSSSNIFLDESSSRVKIGDFGIAKIGLIDLHPISPGNAQYSAPERSQGVHIDAKVDIFSLGKILLELISGITTATERAKIFKEFSKESGFILPAFLYQVDGEVSEDGKLIKKLTSVDPRDRPSAEELSSMLKLRNAV